MFDKAVHFRAAPFLSSELRPRQKIYTDSEVFKETRVGKVFFYIHGLELIRVHTLIFFEILKLAAMSLDAIKAGFRLIRFQQWYVRLRGHSRDREHDSLDRLSGHLGPRLSGCTSVHVLNI